VSATLRQQGGRLVLDGVVGFDNAAALCAEGLGLVGKSGPAIVLDLSALKSENSVTVAIVVQWARAAARAGRQLTLSGVPEQFAAIVRVSGLTPTLLPEPA
jgi:phospholipid transport system transporter-binding protein